MSFYGFNFTKIIAGEISCYKIAETENCFAFLDISPLAPGHTLVVPKNEVDYIFDISDPLFIELQLFAKRVAAALKKSVPCKRIGVAVIGLEVLHAHIHLIPINNVSDMNFARPKLSLSKEQMEQIAKDIAINFK
ncbi:MAG: HIT family protein [Bacteroidetes bacterium]|nr:HIT family protein [Bacteroidota bacterium]